MGTASTMASIAEALGMALPGTAAIPAVHADRLRAAEASGRRAAEMAKSPLRPSKVITEKSVENALRVLLAIGGSTNAIVHLTAIAGRAGIQIDLKRLNALSDSTPVLVDLKPTGQHYMSDLYAAGGVGAVMRELKPLLHLNCMTVAGMTLEEVLEKHSPWVDRAVVREFKNPISPVGGLVALFGSLAPNGAILKRSAADPKLFEKEGRAVVFSSLDDLSERIDDPALDVTADDFLVLQNAGPSPATPCRRRATCRSREARARRREGHGADLGRAHERHRVRHDRAACIAGSGGRRPARAGEEWRPDRLSVKERRIDLALTK